MRARWTRIVIVAATLIVLVAVNGSIVAKERIKTHGERIYLALAPVDPRSLMQGDYMALRFVVADQIPPEESGTWPLRVDERGVAAFVPERNAPGLRIRYRVRNGRVWLGTNAYFFEEGTAERYANAAFGEFRVDRESGEAILVGLRGRDLEPL
jgi:uncharacterized membrane-anchored protein